MTDQAVVDTMVERIVTRFQPARILLFGSRARGSDNRWSDVDLLVVMDEVEDKRRAAVEMGRARRRRRLPRPPARIMGLSDRRRLRDLAGDTFPQWVMSQ